MTKTKSKTKSKVHTHELVIGIDMNYMAIGINSKSNQFWPWVIKPRSTYENMQIKSEKQKEWGIKYKVWELVPGEAPQVIIGVICYNFLIQ